MSYVTIARGIMLTAAAAAMAAAQTVTSGTLGAVLSAEPMPSGAVTTFAFFGAAVCSSTVSPDNRFRERRRRKRYRLWLTAPTSHRECRR